MLRFATGHTAAPHAQFHWLLIRAMSTRPIKKILAANRSEIAIRIFRAATELDIKTVAIYAKEDVGSVHRYKADQSFQLHPSNSPVGAYLNSDEIIKIALENDVDAIHPGYGFLSENVRFAQLCEDNGIQFVGPTAVQLAKFGDKTKARELAINAGLPVVPGTDTAVSSYEDARAFTEEFGYPIIIKAAHGGGGKGMRIVRNAGELEENFSRATSEAAAAFGNGEVFIERYIEKPRHIEVQVIGDGSDVVHLYERDCSVQRRHQKVVEVAPAVGLPEELRNSLTADAVNLCKAAGYRNAGTVEFLFDTVDNKYYFIEVNPRIQVEHTVTEQVTGIDLVQSQIRIAGGESLEELGLVQDRIHTRGHAIQCRITTEDPLHDFQPDTGRISVWRPGDGMGIRLDGVAYPGSIVSPYYDSMLMKVTGNALTFPDTAAKVERALNEFRIRGVKTNIPFLLNVLRHEEFLTGTATTDFISKYAHTFSYPVKKDRATKLCNYLGDLIVNGRSVVGAVGPDPITSEAIFPPNIPKNPKKEGFRNVLVEQGPAAFAKAVREHDGPLFTDTTWRDAHQSLLATRLRTTDMEAIAIPTSHAFAGMYSIENWGGATFDVAMRFLHEDPWERLGRLRELVPNIPFQMLFRGANAVGYTSYPDNCIDKFCELAQSHGMDIFRVFDSLNYLENLQVGIEAAGKAGGVVEGCLCYTGDVSNPDLTKYTIEYYLDLAEKLVAAGAHVLCIKDMAGLLKPKAATMLVSALRAQHPTVPIHVHTHDTSGLGVMSMIAALDAGADVVDGAVDSMSGTTSQPSLGAMVAHYKSVGRDTGIDPRDLRDINEYWESVRMFYSPFESGQKTGSADVYIHEIPGGQYTNLYFQANQLGLASRWREIKKAYASANRLLGDIVKVTPSSKVVGDLAQFMVQNKLSEEDVVNNAEGLSFPSSVVEYFRGLLGYPQGGFPEPLRSRVLKGADAVEGRPGASMAPLDFDALRQQIFEKHAEDGQSVEDIPMTNVMSAAMYPKEFDEFMRFKRSFGEVSYLPTLQFIRPMAPGESITVELEKGKAVVITHIATGALNSDGNREVIFEVNGMQRSVVVEDRKAAADAPKARLPKATQGDKNAIGAPMPGAVVGVKVSVGQIIEKGAPCVVLNAMKMETVVGAPKRGRVKAVHVDLAMEVTGGDLLVELEDVE
eukprot:m.288038 g.288038  ORF g.288038 m.288038 type:complete len:1180 (-) comp11885_c0_seq1:18-3557(-)